LFKLSVSFRLSNQNHIYAFIVPPYMSLAESISSFFDVITLIIFGVGCNSRGFLLCSFLQFPVSSSPVCSKCPHSTLLSKKDSHPHRIIGNLIALFLLIFTFLVITKEDKKVSDPSCSNHSPNLICSYFLYISVFPRWGIGPLFFFKLRH
jgi:hypothetical protein